MVLKSSLFMLIFKLISYNIILLFNRLLLIFVFFIIIILWLIICYLVIFIPNFQTILSIKKLPLCIYNHFLLHLLYFFFNLLLGLLSFKKHQMFVFSVLNSYFDYLGRMRWRDSIMSFFLRLRWLFCDIAISSYRHWYLSRLGLVNFNGF